MRKTIFIIITSGFASRNVLYTEVFNILRSSPHRLVFFVPPGTKSNYSSFEENGKVIFEEYVLPGLLEGKLGSLRLLNSFSQGTTFKLQTQSIREKREKLKEKGAFKFYLLRLFTFLVSFNFVFRALKTLDWFIFRKNWLKTFFRLYKPDLIYSTDPLFFGEIYFLEYARIKKIKIVSQILSWDNLTNRGCLAVVPDICVVWNNIMKDQLVNLYDFKPENIFVSGVPHFDIYFQELPVTKQVFFENNKLNAGKKLITFFTSSPGNFPNENISIKEIIFQLATLPGFFDKHQVLIRINPKDHVDRHREILEMSGVFLQRIGVVDNRFRDNWNPKKNEMIELAATLKFSNAVICMSSTICIEAAIYNVPEVVLDTDPAQHYFYKMDHFLPIIKSGGIRLVTSTDEACRALIQYLDDRNVDLEGRKRIVDEQCVFMDGNSARRVADFLLKIV